MLDKGIKSTHGERILPSINGVGKLDNHMEKNEIKLSCTPLTKVNST